MNVVIVGNFWFPHGTASAARIRNLALGLRDCGARVHVVSMAPHPSRNRTGDHEGVTYECAAPTAAVVEGWRDAERSIPRLRDHFTDKVRWFAGLYAATPIACRRVRRLIDRRQCDLVLAYDRSALRMTPVALLCRAHGIPSVLDVVEVSEHLTGSRFSAVYWDSVAGTRSTPRLFDGLTVITAGLEARYRAAGCVRTLIVPAIEDWPPAPPPPAATRPVFRLTYVGALQARDAPELLLGALRILAQQRQAVALDVVGHYEGTRRAALLTRLCSEDPMLRSVVRFLGSLSDRALAEHLASSDGLVLIRRDAPTEELSFPTRLVEYLRCGRPVFVSDVGDVARYLRDGRDAVLLHPRDPQRIAAAIAGVAARPDRGAEIGRRGHEAGARAFDRKTHARRLMDFAAALRPGAAA